MLRLQVTSLQAARHPEAEKRWFWCRRRSCAGIKQEGRPLRCVSDEKRGDRLPTGGQRLYSQTGDESFVSMTVFMSITPLLLLLPRCLLLSSLIQRFASACSCQIFFQIVAERSEGDWTFCTSLGLGKAAGPLSASSVLPLKHIMSKKHVCIKSAPLKQVQFTQEAFYEQRVLSLFQPPELQQ